MDKINLRTTAFNDNDFEAEPFADAVISISQNCMPFEGYSITDVRLVNDDEDYPFGYAIVHAYYHEEEIYIDSMIPLHPDASELEAISSICLYMDREPLWKISVLQGPEAQGQGLRIVFDSEFHYGIYLAKPYRLRRLSSCMP